MLDEAAEDARRWGFPDEIVAELETGGEQEAFGVWPANWPIVTAFLAVDTQWRALPMAGGAVYWMGLDYAGVAAGLAPAGIALTPEQWAGLQQMEAAARNALNGVQG